MEIHLPIDISPLQHKDITIMEVFVQGDLQEADLRVLNEVHMSKEVVWLLGISVAQGNKLSPMANNKQRSYSETVWPEHAPIDSFILNL